MADDKVQGCVASAEGPIVPSGSNGASKTRDQQGSKEEKRMHVMVGKEAPDFGATAFHKGGFTSVKLSDFRGKWVFLCFYPGDFTFV
jgi:peroxiredoxin (alkyl hydroperoxide reductase subunit C)